jgi:plastocyanin
MTLKMRAVAILAIALAVSTIALAACGGPTTTDIIQTVQAEEQISRALTQTAVAASSTGGVDSAANRARTAVAGTQMARQTAEANASPTVGGNTGGLPYGDLQPDAIDGEPQTGEVVIDIGNNGVFTPEMVKVSVGTTVTWQTSQRTASSSTSFPDQADTWDSGPLSKGTFDTEPKRWSRVFETPGCFQYQSRQSGQSTTGAVCVVE